MALTISRYGEVSPTEIHSSGIAVSTPIYITLTTDQRKALLNRLHQLEQEWQQRLLMQPSSGPPQRPANDERRAKQAPPADLPQKECQGCAV